MKIPFSEISSTGARYTLNNLTVPCDKRDFELQGPIELSCSLQRKGKDRVVLQGMVQAILLLRCSRCLAGFPFQVHANMQLIYELVDAEHCHLKEVDLSAGELDVIELLEPVLDLEDVARQQLYMALPVRQICSEQCLGICPECGNNLNDSTCDCKRDKKNSPFDVLAALKNK
ncbi:MAG: DUF177 domain-containing protein [Desulfobulbaceae bacterium]|nr:DUF177 domain-containing protein [Desulfobulbaceae bacterium]